MGVGGERGGKLQMANEPILIDSKKGQEGRDQVKPVESENHA